MEFFSKGISSTPMLEIVQKTAEENKGDWLGDLNSTIRFLYKNMVGFCGVQHLKVSEFSNLRDRWHNELPVELFCELESLVIDEVALFSACAMPSDLLEYLNKLEKLDVSNCEVLEDVFDVRGLGWEHGHSDFLSTLVKFHLLSLPRLRNIWNEDAQGILSFKHLKSLKVHFCNRLKMTFTPSMARELVQLQEIEVKNCNSVEEIITRGAANEVMNAIVFPLLKTIILESLPSLLSFSCRSKILECPALEKIAIVECPTAFTCTFLREMQSNLADGLTEPKVVFPNLHNLKLSSVQIQEIWYNKKLQEISAFTENLTQINIDGCNNLKYLFSSSMVKSFIHLKTLEVCNCKLMQEIIHVEKSAKMNEIVLRKLDFLSLQNLQQLTQFCTGSLIECVDLTSLWIANCPELGAFVSNSAISNNLNCSWPTDTVNGTLFDEKVAFPNLERLIIHRVHELKIIWANELREDSFRKLKALRVEDAKNAVKVFPTNLELTRFQNLEILFIIGCNALSEVFDIRALIDIKEERGGVTVSQLKILKVSNNLNLKHVWNEDPEVILNFRSLNEVDIRQCPSLENVIPASTARGLVHLEKLCVLDSAVKEIIMGDEEPIQDASVFEFPRLKELFLRRLPQLDTFYPGTHTSDWPALQQLYITQCYQFHLPNLSLKKIIPNLEELALNGKEVKMLRESQLPMELFCKLKVVEFNFFNEKFAVFPYDLLHIFHNLETLTVSRSNFKELFPLEGGVFVDDEKDPLILTRMHSLKLYELPYLKAIWNQVLQTLETLVIEGCDSVITRSSASFQTLTSLDIYNCRRLVSLMTFSTATSLMRLQKLRLSNCNQINVIVSDDGEETLNEINFIKLETLVVVNQCPKMEFFSRGVSRTSMLEIVQQTENENTGDWLGNLNLTIRFLYKKMVGFRGLQNLKLSEFANLKDRWHDELPVEIFCDLNSLVIDEVAFSSYAIQSNLLENLNKLDKLEVNNCELLEQVFDLQGLIDEARGQRGPLPKLNSFYLINLPRLRLVWNEHPPSILNFKNLRSLKVHSCRSLKMIFTPSMTRGLVQLQEMEVKNCVSMEEIISEGAKEDDMINFPKLNSLFLDSLPQLTVFRPGRGIVQCPSLEKLFVRDCPYIQVFTSSFDEEEPTEFDGNAILFGKVKCKSVKELRVDWSVGIKKTLDGELAATHEFFSNLKVVELKHFPIEYSIFPSRFLERSPNLEELLVSDASFEELFSQEENLNEAEYLTEVAHLRRLTLSKLPQLRQLIKNQAEPGSLFQHLEALEVSECTKLMILVPSSISFENLMILKFSKCHRLLNLITSSTARSFSQLKRLEIAECEMVEEIVSIEEDEVEAEIRFSQLKHLELHTLPKLTRFCSGNESFNFPSLEEVIVKDCPEMEIFVQGEVFAPNLECVQTTKDENESCWDGSLNATIQNLFKQTNDIKVEEH